MELLVGMNGQLTERRETKFEGKRRKFCIDQWVVLTEFVPFYGILFVVPSYGILFVVPFYGILFKII